MRSGGKDNVERSIAGSVGSETDRPRRAGRSIYRSPVRRRMLDCAASRGATPRKRANAIRSGRGTKHRGRHDHRSGIRADRLRTRQAGSARLADDAARAGRARDRAGGGPRQPPRAADRLAGEAGRPVRRQISHHRFFALELRQLGRAPHRHLHPVQGAEPDPPRAARLELPRRAIPRVRRVAARAAARHRRTGTRAPPTRSIRTSTSCAATRRSTS